MITDEELNEAIMLAALLGQFDVVPNGLRMDYHARVDRCAGHATRCVRVYPDDVDPGAFDFGVPGAYASLSVVSHGTGSGYRVHIFARDVAYNVQSAGHVVTYTNPTEAVHTAVWQIQDHIRQQQARGR